MLALEVALLARDFFSLCLKFLFLSSSLSSLFPLPSPIFPLPSPLFLPTDSLRSRKLPPMALVKMHYQNDLRAMREALDVLGDARRAPKKAASPSPPAVGRAVLGAITACSQTSFGVHLASAALERGLAETEQRHAQGSQFLHANLVDPILARVGGAVAAAVVKCCLPGVGPQPLDEQGSGGGGGGGCADVDPSSAAAAVAAAAAQNKFLAAMMKLDESDLAKAPELVPGAVLGRLAKLVQSMNADLAALPLLEQKYNKACKAAKDASSEVIDAAEALCKRAAAAAAVRVHAAATAAVRVPAAAAAAAVRVPAAAAAAAGAGARKPKADFLPDLVDEAKDDFDRFFEKVHDDLLGNTSGSFEAEADALTARVPAAAAPAAAAAGARNPKADFLPDLLDDSNDEFNHVFAEVDAKLLRNLAESFEGVADASAVRVERAYSALQASMDRHQAKEVRDAMMLRSLRRIAEGGGKRGAPVPVLAAILDAYEAAVEAKRLNSAADLAAAEVSAAAADAAASSAAASVAALARPAAAPACTAAACNKNKNNGNAKSTNKKKNKNKKPNCSGCGCCCGSGGACAAAAPAPTASTAPARAFIEPAAYAPLYRLFFAHWVSSFFGSFSVFFER